jgi:hypothetical protein
MSDAALAQLLVCPILGLQTRLKIVSVRQIPGYNVRCVTEPSNAIKRRYGQMDQGTSTCAWRNSPSLFGSMAWLGPLFLDSWPLNLEPTCFPETSVRITTTHCVITKELFDLRCMKVNTLIQYIHFSVSVRNFCLSEWKRINCGDNIEYVITTSTHRSK